MPAGLNRVLHETARPAPFDCADVNSNHAVSAVSQVGSLDQRKPAMRTALFGPALENGDFEREASSWLSLASCRPLDDAVSKPAPAICREKAKALGPKTGALNQGWSDTHGN